MDMAVSRQVSISTPTIDDELLFVSMQGSERLGQLFQYDLVLYSENYEIDINEILGQSVTIHLQTADGTRRCFNGCVSAFSQRGEIRSGLAVYAATLRPWLWFLTRTADCRIFQNQSVPDIVKAVCNEHGFSDIEDQLYDQYREWDYRVQYRETDFNFVSRLLEQEGIYYYFKHQDNKHTLVLADCYSAHEAISHAELPYYPPGSESPEQEEHVCEWFIHREVQPGAYVLNDYDFKRPKTSLRVRQPILRHHAGANYEVYDYPGEYLQNSDGDQYAQRRIEELHVQFEQVRGTCDARELMAGRLFTLGNYPRTDQNREYLVVSADYALENNEYSTGEGSSRPVYRCYFTAIESRTPFRPARVTTKPVVQGPQTAIVVGPEGEEIYTDKVGRIKVQFHWDREGHKNENSSCWMRVVHAWAGKRWGTIHLPRVGHEVMVEFLEGDPDRPIVTGSVYNGENNPPYELPANATQSGIKSRSSKCGTHNDFNEIRFEDKKDQEEIYVHAERNLKTVVESNDCLSVGNNRTHTVANEERVKIKKLREQLIGEDAGAGSSDLVDGSVIYGKRLTTVKGDDGTVVEGSSGRMVVVEQGDNKTHVYKGEQRFDVLEKDFTVSVAQGDVHLIALSGDQNVHGQHIVLNARKPDQGIDLLCYSSAVKVTNTSVSLQCGASKIELTPTEIVIKAPLVRIN